MQYGMDVDIDLQSKFSAKEFFPEWTLASKVEKDLLKPHPCGIHPNNVPIDGVTGLSAIPFKEAQPLGFFKLDMLHLSIYDHFKSREEIDALLEIEPDWKLLRIPSVAKSLFQLGNHFELTLDLKPNSIDDLADLLALIRPQKRGYVDAYKRDKLATRSKLFVSDGEGYSFKKAHAYSYALVIWLQMHLIDAGISFA